MLPGYLDLIREAGGVPVIFPMEGETEDLTQLCQMCDGFLFTGGEDVDPTLYGEEAIERCGAANPRRDRLERVVFDYAMERDAPILGICRGIQLLNVFLGGRLYQDLPSQQEAINSIDKINHQMTPPYDRAVHRVQIVEGSPLWEVVKSPTLGVNSYHHQAIKDLAPRLTAMAHSEDGLVEAFYLEEARFLEAYQWHPELSFKVDNTSLAIAKRFISASTPL